MKLILLVIAPQIMSHRWKQMLIRASYLYMSSRVLNHLEYAFSENRI